MTFCWGRFIIFEIISITMIEGEGDLIAELLCITGELGGKMQRLTTYNSQGITSKKIVIEYDVTHEKKK